VSALAQFVQPLADNPFQGALPSREQDHKNLPLVTTATNTPDIAVHFETIDQTHGAVMPKKQALRQTTYSGLVLVSESSNGKKHLVLLRFEADGFCGVIAAS